MDDISTEEDVIESYLHDEDERELTREEQPLPRNEFLQDFYVSNSTIVSNREFLRVILQERRTLERYRQLLSQHSSNDMSDENPLTNFLEEQVDFLISLAEQNLVIFVNIFLRLPIEYGELLYRASLSIAKLDNISILQEYEKHNVRITYIDIIETEAGNIAEYLVIRGLAEADLLYKRYIEVWSVSNRHITGRFCSVIYHILQYTSNHSDTIKRNDSYYRPTQELYSEWNPYLSPFDVLGLYAADKRRVEEIDYDPHFAKLVEALLRKHGTPEVKTKVCWSFLELIEQEKYDIIKTLLDTNAFDLSDEEDLIKEATEYGADMSIISLLIHHGAPTEKKKHYT